MILMKNFDMIIPEGRTAVLNGMEYTIKKVPARVTLELLKALDNKTNESNSLWFEFLLEKTVIVLNSNGYHLVTKESMLDSAELEQLTEFCRFIVMPETIKDTKKNEEVPEVPNP